MKKSIEEALAELKKRLPFEAKNGGKIVDFFLEDNYVVIVFDTQQTMKLRQEDFYAMFKFAQSP